ncbi:MAG: hypothetical protein JWQ09_3461 [Segetibacter sp.]|nr:hypothetical protein [Segetibacter sp.]
MNTNSVLGASAQLSFDSAGNMVIPKVDSTFGPVLNQVPDIGELIRSTTFLKYGNQVYYSSKIGEPAELSDCPRTVRNSNYYQAGPMCRRTLLYFHNNKVLSLASFFNKLTDKNFDRETSPIELNPSRNAKLKDGKKGYKSR